MNKKITILFVLRMLQGTTKDTPLSQITMAKIINLAGYKCDRKTIARDIDTLIEFGYQIVKVKGIGCYLASTELSNKVLQKNNIQ